jgi:hypothetical protein
MLLSAWLSTTSAFDTARNWMPIILSPPQPPTIIMCDNTCAIGIATDSIKQKRSKAIDMRFHWVRDRVRQGQFIISYIISVDNIADYFTKNLDPLKQKFFMQFLAPIATKL